MSRPAEAFLASVRVSSRAITDEDLAWNEEGAYPKCLNCGHSFDAGETEYYLLSADPHMSSFGYCGICIKDAVGKLMPARRPGLKLLVISSVLISLGVFNILAPPFIFIQTDATTVGILNALVTTISWFVGIVLLGVWTKRVARPTGAA